MSFVINGLSPDAFSDAFRYSGPELDARSMRRVTADEEYAFPCRVSLEDAVPGEELLLLPYVHQSADTPYRASGPIFVRRSAGRPARFVGEVPAMLARRQLSIRAYDDRDSIVDAEVTAGELAATAIAKLLASPRVAYLHVHFARFGCFACRVDRYEPRAAGQG